MTRGTKWVALLIIMGILSGARQVGLGAPMGTAITYQGRFTAGGSPASGLYDFEFKVFDAVTGGSQVGSTIAKEVLSVADGYFTTTLDFGAGVFVGSARWLQIAVRPGAETGAYTTLTPRHELTPTPYALYASNQGSANYLPKFTSSGLANSVLFESSGKVGLGTTTPLSTLHVNSGTANNVARFESTDPAALILLKDNNTTGSGEALCRIGDDLDLRTNDVARVLIRGGTGNVMIGPGDPGTARLYVNGEAAGVAPNIRTTGDIVVGPWGGIFFDGYHSYGAGNYIMPVGAANTQGFFTAGAERMRLTSTGNIGMGTTAPTQKLDVSGTVRCVSLIQTSDEQLKTDVRPLGGVLAKLDQVRAVSFQWNERAGSLGAATGTRQIGVLAQELERVFPELVVTPEPATLDELIKGYPEKMLTAEVKQRLQQDVEKSQYKAVDYSELTVVLLAAVKELQAQNQVLEQRLQALESKAR